MNTFYTFVFALALLLPSTRVCIAQPGDPHTDHGKHLGWYKHHDDDDKAKPDKKHHKHDRDDDDDFDWFHHRHHHHHWCDSSGCGCNGADSTGNAPTDQLDGHNPFGLSDSCFAYFLTLLPSDTAALLTTDLALVDSDGMLIDSLVVQWRKSKRAQDSIASDSLSTLIDSLVQESIEAGVEVMQIARSEVSILSMVRQTCGDDTTSAQHRMPAALGVVRVSAVSPNPILSSAGAQFRVTSTLTSTLDVGLYDVTGMLTKQLYSGDIRAGVPITLSFGVEHLMPGLYLLRVQTNTLTQTQQVIVR